MAALRDNPDPYHLDVAIVGGGISGLAAAFRLRTHQESSRPLSVRLFEASGRLGGTIQTERLETEEQGYCVCEAGPDSMVTTRPAAIDLCRELGLGDALVAPRSAAAFSVVHGQRLYPLPAGFRLIAPTERWPLLRSGLFSWPGKLRMLRESRVKVSDELAADESVESFVVRRFGREAFERVAEPVLGGLFVADATTLSAARTLGPFVELEGRYGSVLRGLRDTSRASSSPAQLTLGRGLGSLVERLSEQIPSTWIELDCAAKQIRPLPRAGWQIETARGMWLARDVLLACVKGHAGIKAWPQPYVVFMDFGDSALLFQLRFFIRNIEECLSTASDVRFAIDAAFREVGITIPFPQRDVHVIQASGQAAATEAKPEEPAAPPSGKVLPISSGRRADDSGSDGDRGS